MKKIINLPKIAEPSIEQVFEEFLSEQSKTLKPKTASGYRDVIRLFQDCMNGYAYQSLSKAEASLFDKYYNAEGQEHKEFCQLFGPEKITENTGEFLGYFMVRKVMAGGDFKRLAGTVIKKLSKWLTEEGYISKEDAAMSEKTGADASKYLPKAEKAASILYRAGEALDFEPDDLNDEDYHDFDHYTIEKIEPGNLWLEVYDEKGKRTVGPIEVPKEASALLQAGWNISCAIARLKNKWWIVEVANVYPH
jgi:hypothetical protein